MNAFLKILFGTIILFVLGWFFYPWLMEIIIPANSVTLISESSGHAFIHRGFASASFALLGFVFGAGIQLCKVTKTYLQSISTVILILFIVAILAVFGWILFLKHRMLAMLNNLQNMPDELKNHLSISIDAIPLYEIGLFASLLVFIATAILIFWHKKTARN